MVTLGQDFDSFVNQSDGIDGIKNLKKDKKLETRKDKIEAELKLLEWHKMANSAAIKAALLQTKSTKLQSPAKPPNHAIDDAKWIKRVIQEEQVKPLEVSKDFVLEYEKRERENADRLTSQVERHISTLKTLRIKLESRHDLKARSEDYRNWQKDFVPKKNAVLIGKTLDQYQKTSPQTSPHGDNRKQEEEDKENDDDINAAITKHSNRTLGKGQSSQELSTVLDSLNKLAELEQRITSLEKENQYDQLKAKERPSANERNAVEFKKKRTALTNDVETAGKGPVGLVYELHNKKPQRNAWQLKVPNQPAVSLGGKYAAGNGSMAARARQQRMMDDEEEGENGMNGGYESMETDDEEARGPGIFITEGSGDAKRDQIRRERQRQLALASAGQKNLRTRIQSKKGRVKEQMVGAKKHEDAMRELARRKQEQLARKSGGLRGGGGMVPPSKGIGSGIKNRNKHLQEFEKLKLSHRKKKEEAERNLLRQDPNRLAKAAGNNNMIQKYSAQTVPAVSSQRNNYPLLHPSVASAAINGNRRQPATKGGGTTTRRTDQPTRRNMITAQTALVSHMQDIIAVKGMGGIRAIKQTKVNGNGHRLQVGKR